MFTGSGNGREGRLGRSGLCGGALRAYKCGVLRLRYASLRMTAFYKRALPCLSIGEEVRSSLRDDAHLSDDKAVAKMGHPHFSECRGRQLTVQMQA